MARFERSILLALLGVTTLLLPASAQVPTDAPPGTICVTPINWCRVQAGPPGAPCSCPSGSGWVQGVLR